MKEKFIISKMDLGRLDEALTLIQKVFLEYEAPDYSDEGIQEFMRFVETDAIMNV